MPARLSTAPVLPAIALHATHLKLDSNGDASGTAAITKYEVDRYSFVAWRP
jgi:hypothetical protein